MKGKLIALLVLVIALLLGVGFIACQEFGAPVPEQNMEPTAVQTEPENEVPGSEIVTMPSDTEPTVQEVPVSTEPEVPQITSPAEKEKPTDSPKQDETAGDSEQSQTPATQAPAQEATEVPETEEPKQTEPEEGDDDENALPAVPF